MFWIITLALAIMFISFGINDAERKLKLGYHPLQLSNVTLVAAAMVGVLGVVLGF